jgi:restriction endonuclease S subunit
MKYRTFEEFFLVPLRNGLTKPKRVRGEGYKMVNMGELFKYSRMKNIPMDRVPLNEKEYLSSMVVAGDLLFARQSLVLEGAGQCSIFIEDAEEVCFESHLIRCRLNKKIANPLFYYYFFSSKLGKQVINAIVEQGAGAAGIRGSDLSKVLVPDIDIVTQNNVVRVVDNIDSKIELNRQINQTLESMAQAIFQSWFVDFDPVKAKIAAREQWQILTDDERTEWLNEPLESQGYLKTCLLDLTAKAGLSDAENVQLKSSLDLIYCRGHGPEGSENLDIGLNSLRKEWQSKIAGPALKTASETLYLHIAAMTAISSRDETSLADMPADEFSQLYKTASLFPERLVESELGEMPEGWEVLMIKDFGDVVCGKTPSKSNPLNFSGDIPFIKIPDMHNSVYVTNPTDTLSYEGMMSQPKKTIPAGSICVSCIATVGKVVITECASQTNQQINSIVPRESFFTEFLYFYMCTLNSHFHDLASGGSATLNMNTSTFSSIKIIKPNENLLIIFSDRVRWLFKRILLNSNEIITLEKARDALLPKLLSGEFDLSALTEL